MELRPGYKLTEIGVIPEDWQALPASQIGRFRGGTGFPLSFQGLQEGTFPFYKVSDMNNDGNDIFMDAANNWVTEETRRRVGAHAFPAGSIVFAKVGAAVFLERKKILSRSSCIDNNMAAFILDEAQASVPFVHSQLLAKKLGDLVATTALPSLSGKVLGEMVLAVPPLPEQSAIATALSDVDALLAAQDALIAKKRAIKQGAMQELLTGKRRLPGFRGEWQTKKLGDISHIKTGSRNNEDKVEDGDYPFFVRSEFVERIDGYSYDCEAILVPGEGKIGEIFHYINGRFDVHQRVYAITRFAQEVSASFVHLYLKMHFGQWAMQNTVKATVDSLRLPTFQNFEMRLPPTKEEQIAIADALSDLEMEIVALEAKREKTAQLKQGMMQELLTGRIRLV